MKLSAGPAVLSPLPPTSGTRPARGAAPAPAAQQVAEQACFCGCAVAGWSMPVVLESDCPAEECLCGCALAQWSATGG